MKTVAGIFKSYLDAGRAAELLRSAGVTEEQINFLAPEASKEEIEKAVPTTETEGPGMGGAIGGTVGGALGVAGGMHIGAAAASLFVPGVGPILAAGILGATLLGAGGLVAGASAGEALEDEMADGMPHDELYVYEDALRRGRTVLFVTTTDDEQAGAVRTILNQAGAESIDAAREQWWVGLRDAEEEEYARQGRDFKSDETIYRRGFESSLHPRRRGKAYDEVSEGLRKRFGQDCDQDCFRKGYERGQAYQRSFGEKYKR